MKKKGEKEIKVKPVFLLGKNPTFIREDELGFRDVKEEAEQNARTDEILERLNLGTEPKLLVKKGEDLKKLNTDVDAFIIFSHCVERFPLLINLACTGKPIIITSEEGAAGETLDIYEYISEFGNVNVVFSYEEIRKKIRVLKTEKQLMETKVCVFDLGERSLEESGWYKNPLLQGKFKTQYIDVQDFENRYKNVDQKEALNLAKEWMDEAEVIEPTLDDVAKSARLYIAMKNIIEDMKANVAYVLWCGQFGPMLGTKMCFAIAKLNDDGILTGCWRGENLMPMLILNAVSEKSIFFGEVHMYRDGVLSLRHCAVSQKIANCKYVLRRWRDREGTVTGYCEMPKGEVTLVNSSQGDRVVVVRGNVIDSRDIEGENCRTTVWIKIEDEKVVNEFDGREFAMVYGDYLEEAREVVEMLGIKAI